MAADRNDLLVWRQALSSKMGPARKVSAGDPCRLSELSGFDDEHLLRRGEPLAPRWPNDVRYAMDKSKDYGEALLDSVSCRLPVVIASPRLAEFLKGHAGESIECLPLSILDKKRKPVKDAFFIVRPLGLEDVLDAKKSGAVRDPGSDTIDAVKRLVLDPSKIATNLVMLRLARYMRPILVRRWLAEAVAAAGFTGMAWQEPADHSSV